MDALENYLTGKYHIDVRELNQVERLLREVASTYACSEIFGQQVAWAYDVQNVGQVKLDKLSQSTTAMILCSLLRLRGDLHYASHANDPRQKISKIELAPMVHSLLQGRISTGGAALISDILSQGVRSTTYGSDDPLTHAWLAELSKLDWPDNRKGWETQRAELKKKAEERLKKPSDFMFDLSTARDKQGKEIRHAFLVLRTAQALRVLDETAGTEVFFSAHQFFETILHKQLSYSSIPDSRFDPAELTFCLEGMMLCQPQVVDRALFERVLAVLTTAQKENAYWRPVKPLLATSQGFVLLPVSVEVANSLLRSCFLRDGDEIHDTVGSKYIDLFRRYWQWLQARVVRFSRESENFVGWHSEHVNETGLIHLWETSQVLEFLLLYRAMLQLHIARTVLVQSRFKEENATEKTNWEKITKDFEPISNLSPSLRSYHDVGLDFIYPRLNAAEVNNYAMLLYGPPGTGKTTLAKNVAKALGYRLITISVGDFLAGGEAQIEARAKSIFTVLEAQPYSVVLFDEIDNFLLDRDSKRYRDQQTIFQFLTPGMLTKFNDLRASKRVVVIISTNYADRIDPAIKRTGRIDKFYLLLPPETQKRIEILKRFINGDMIEQHKCDLGVASLFLSYQDIESATNEFKRIESQTPEALIAILTKRSRTISLESYSSRFRSDQPKPFPLDDTPMVEFLCLLAMHLESGKSISEQSKDTIKAATKVFAPNGAFSVDTVPIMLPELPTGVFEQVKVTLAGNA